MTFSVSVLLSGSLGLFSVKKFVFLCCILPVQFSNDNALYDFLEEATPWFFIFFIIKTIQVVLIDYCGASLIIVTGQSSTPICVFLFLFFNNDQSCSDLCEEVITFHLLGMKISWMCVQNVMTVHPTIAEFFTLNHKQQPAGGGRGKVTHSQDYILWWLWMCKQNVITIHQIVFGEVSVCATDYF